jgi:hypothetical protein
VAFGRTTVLAFETYLGNTRARPPLATALGYIASLAVHGPPLAVFVSTWLTHSLLIGYSGPAPTRVRMVPAYQIPVSMMQASATLGDGKGGSGGGGKAQRRRGLRGRAGRSARRGLLVPKAIKPLPDAAVAEANSFLAWLDGLEGGAAGGGVGEGDGAARAGVGAGDGGEGKNSGGGGNALTAGGGAGAPAVVVGTPPAMAAAAPKLPKPPAPPKEHIRVGGGNAPGPAEDVAEEDDVVVPPAPGRPYKASYLSESMAAYYRTYEVFPGMPESFWYGGVTSYMLAIEICVSTEGAVSNVTFRQGDNEDVNKLVGGAIRSWRYRPRIVGGSPRPFCHPMLIEYSRGLRAFSH